MQRFITKFFPLTKPWMILIPGAIEKRMETSNRFSKNHYGSCVYVSCKASEENRKIIQLIIKSRHDSPFPITVEGLEVGGFSLCDSLYHLS